jgi:hypothetical protein
MFLSEEVQSEPNSILFKVSSDKKFRFVEWQTWPFDKPQPSYGYTKGINEFDEFSDIREVIEYFGYTVFFRDVNVDM